MIGKYYIFIFVTFLLDRIYCNDLKVYIDGPGEILESDSSVKYYVYRLSGSGNCKQNIYPSKIVNIKENNTHFFNSSLNNVSYTLIITKDNFSDFDKEVIFSIECIDKSNGYPLKFKKHIKIKDNDKHALKSTFLMRNFLLNVLHEGSLEAMYVYTLKGMANCNITSSNPSRLEIIGKSKRLLMANVATYVMLYAVNNNYTFGQVTESVMFDCIDKNTDKTISYHHEITIIDNKVENKAETLEFGLLSSQEVNENEDIGLVFIPHAGSGVCSISLNENEYAYLIGPKVFSLDMKNVFILKPKLRFSLDDCRVSVHVICRNETTQMINSVKKEIVINKNLHETPGLLRANGDPHFTQIVSDVFGNSNRYICYDVTGQAGDSIDIFQTTIGLKVAVFGVLKDDYYMHKIFVRSPYGNITINTNYIYMDDRQRLKWKNQFVYQPFIFGRFLVDLQDNTIKLSIGRDDVQDRSLSIIIKRSHRIITGYSLDVNIEGINGDYFGIDGLIGRIGKNEYRFFEAVQNINEFNDQSQFSKVAVEINGFLKSGKMDAREGLDCWLLRTEDLLYPQSLQDFVHSQ